MLQVPFVLQQLLQVPLVLEQVEVEVVEVEVVQEHQPPSDLAESLHHQPQMNNILTSRDEAAHTHFFLQS